MENLNFNLDTELYRFNGEESFTLRQACEGVQIFGGIGSGKSSGSGAALAKSYLRAGFGGLVLCAKKDEVETWQKYAQETGRSNSLIIFDESGDWRFPFLQYEVNREGAGAGYTENIVRLFSTVYEAISKGSSGNGSDPYWQRAMEQLLRNAIDLSLLARGEISVPLLYDVIISSPRSKEDYKSESWKKDSLCWQLLMEGNKKPLNAWEKLDFKSTVTFWMEEFIHIAPKTRSGIVSMFTTMADNLLRRPFRMLFSESSPEGQDALPELTHEGLIIILNLPVKEFGNAGRAAQVIYKQLWQQAAERRNLNENNRPIFLWVDEAQNFATEYDMQFQATARSSRACTVYLTQNLPNYYAEMGGAHSKSRVDSLIGNLQTKIWHANSDPETNQHAAETIGKLWRQNESNSFNAGLESSSAGQSLQWNFEYEVIPKRFTTLRKGSPVNDYWVDAIIFQNGRKWNKNRMYLLASFHQINNHEI